MDLPVNDDEVVDKATARQHGEDGEEEKNSNGLGLTGKDSSLAVLQDQVEMSGLMVGNKWIGSPVVEARVPLPGSGDPDQELLKERELVPGERKRWSFDL